VGRWSCETGLDWLDRASYSIRKVLQRLLIAAGRALWVCCLCAREADWPGRASYLIGKVLQHL